MTFTPQLVTLAAICIAITLFSLTVAAVAVRVARKEIAHSVKLARLNRALMRLLPPEPAPAFHPEDDLDV